MKVLIVEDSDLIAQVIQKILSLEKIDSMIISDGSKVMDIAKTKHPKLIILDLMMPGMSGNEVFDLLKKDKETKKIKIMILTARADALKWYKALKDADKFMTKPFDNQELVSAVKALIK